MTRVHDVSHSKRPPEIVRWVERFFMRRLNGEYREAMVWPCDVDFENREPRAE